MKKSQATNTFDSGMIMDLNPLVTPNNVLTNCLNGTLITFNGNENVLQNDMGNGRVETAYLPEGYIPMGTAELGGIIYIVSYNPLTNKCQIGSFPSPERNVTSDEIGQCKNISVVNSDFINNEYRVINITKKIKLLEDNKILYPGDKYTIYSTNSGISNNIDNLSGVSYGKYVSPFTVDSNPKYITIHVICINEDGGITYLDDNLKWDKKYGQDILTKKDKYYYIKETELDNIQSDIDEYRSLATSAYNTFKGRVSGELGLLFELKVIESFSLTWDVIKNKGQHFLYFYPSWESSDKDINISHIALLDNTEGIVTFSDQVIYPTEETIKTIPHFNPTIDLETTDGIPRGKINVGIVSITDTPSIWRYTVAPCMAFGILEYLSVSGRIDFSQIGTGNMNLTKWRYYISETAITLNWDFEAYPEKGKSINKIVLTFIPSNVVADLGVNEIDKSTFDISSYYNYNVYNKSSYSGSYQNNFKFQNTSLLPNKLYLVRMFINYGITSNIGEADGIIKYRWIYTTGQFNDVFLNNSAVEDFKTLSLDLDLNIAADINDQINVNSYINIPKLLLDKEPDTPAYQTMGIKTSTVNFKENAYISGGYNMIATINMTPKYNELFSIDDSTGVTYKNNIQNQVLTLKEQTITSEKESEISNVLTSLISQELIDPIYVKRAINEIEITEDLNNNLKDSFTVRFEKPSDSETSKTMHLSISGAIFSRINADLAQKTVQASQTIKPLYFGSQEAVNLGFKGEGRHELSYVYVMQHGDHGNSEPFFFKIYEFENLNETNGQQTHTLETGKSTWDPGDSPTAGTWWSFPSNGNWVYEEFNGWLESRCAPFALVHYENYQYYKAGYDHKEYWDHVLIGNKQVTESDIYGIYQLWVRDSNKRYIPINALWKGNTNITEICHQLAMVLTHIYTVDTNNTSVEKYIVDNINYLNPYEEDWSFNLHSDIKVQNPNNTISIDNDNLTLLHEKIKGFEEDLISNISISKINETELSTVSEETSLELTLDQTVTHTFKLSYANMIEEYENNKSINIGAIYYLPWEDFARTTPYTKNSNYLYIFNSDTGQFEVLDTINAKKYIYYGGSWQSYDSSKGGRYFLSQAPSKYLIENTATIIEALKLDSDSVICAKESSLVSGSLKQKFRTNEGSGNNGLTITSGCSSKQFFIGANNTTIK